jgi:hypothetical protein
VRIAGTAVVVACLGLGCSGGGGARPLADAGVGANDHDATADGAGRTLDASSPPVLDASASPDASVRDAAADSTSAGGEAGAPPPALTWTLEYSGNQIRAVWGSGPNDVYGVGDGSIIVHSSGTGSWAYETTDTVAILYGIWGSGPGDVYIAPYINAILHSTGDGGWADQGFASGAVFKGVWGSGPGDVYTFQTTEHFTADAGWTPVTIGTGGEQVLGMWGSAANDIYAAGNLGNVYHFSGSAWRPQNVVGTTSLTSITGSGPSDIYVTDGFHIYHSTGDGNWAAQSVQLSTSQVVRGLFAVSATAVYAVVDGSVFRSGGDGTWIEQAFAGATSVPAFGIWGSSPRDLYLATTAGVYHGVP